MQNNFTDSIQFHQAAYKMHLKIGGNSETRCFAGFIRQAEVIILKTAETLSILPRRYPG